MTGRERQAEKFRAAVAKGAGNGYNSPIRAKRRREAANGGAVMRYRQILAWFLAAALVAGLTVGSAAAYSDVDPERWSWAWQEIDAMTERGIFLGYGDGTFMPAEGLSIGQGLVVAARLRVSDLETRRSIGLERREEVRLLVGEELSWLWDEAAVCLETGIVSHDELAALCVTKMLTAPLPTENFCVYITRAMGLETMVKQLGNWPLSYSDTAQISTACRPYVYALSVYSIVRGNEAGALNPKVPVNRAQTAVILSRALSWMEAQDIPAEPDGDGGEEDLPDVSAEEGADGETGGGLGAEEAASGTSEGVG